MTGRPPPPTEIPPDLPPQAEAGILLVGQTGATGFALTVAAEESVSAGRPGHPAVWVALASYARPERHEVAAGLSPATAILRLCEQIIDGGECTHCYRPTGFSPDIGHLPMGSMICWYQFDPELAVYRRGCEGDVR